VKRARRKADAVRPAKRDGRERWRRDRGAIAGSVTAVLFVIIITTMLAGVALYYVPAWSKDAESEHMNKVANQFLSVRDGVEEQVAKGPGSPSLYSHIALTSGVTTSFLGMQGTPSKGTLALDTNSSIFELFNSDNASDIYALSKGMLYFQSHNGYYVDQEYSYEEGAVLVRQGTCSTVREGRAPELRRDERGNLTLTVSLYTLYGEAASITGTGSAGVETRIVHTEETIMPFPTYQNITLNATTGHGDGWARWINSSLTAAGPSGNYTAANYSVLQTSYGFRFQAVRVIQLTVRMSIIEVKVSK
jgi:hypothetical protein